jgi:hypothetical protein
MAKAGAVRALAEKLRGRGFSDGAAESLARAAVDPADVRRRLDRPAPIRVPGAVLEMVEADVWAPMVVPYIANYREADARVFPADDTVSSVDAPRYPPLARPKGDSNGRAILDLNVDGREHLVQAIEDSMRYLVDHNSWSDSIAERGVMFPITLVATSVATGDGQHVDIPATADGSSRTASALDVLDIAPDTLVGPFRTDPRELASLIGRVRAIFRRPLEEVSEDELAMANALILPARIVVAFEPDATGSADFAKAVHNYLQLVHGDLPPTPWPDTARVDANADSVVAELEEANIITANKARYFEGMLSPADARKRNFPRAPDERGLMIVTTLSSDKAAVHAAIKAGVIRPSERKNLTKPIKAEICAELALRGARGILTPKEMADARDVLANIYTNAAIWGQGLKANGADPDQLLSDALKEQKAGAGGPATATLGALGGFWLTVHRVLREARFFKEESFTDGRTPSSVLSAMMDSPWGLRVLARAVADGRDGDVVWQVKSNGTRIKGVTGEFLAADLAWLRGKVVPPGDGETGSEGDSAENGDVPSRPDRLLLDRRKRLEDAVQVVEDRHEELRKVLGGDGEPLVDRNGLPSAVAEDLRDRLERIRTKLAVYGDKWSDVSESAVSTAEEPESEGGPH